MRISTIVMVVFFSLPLAFISSAQDTAATQKITITTADTRLGESVKACAVVFEAIGAPNTGKNQWFNDSEKAFCRAILQAAFLNDIATFPEEQGRQLVQWVRGKLSERQACDKYLSVYKGKADTGTRRHCLTFGFMQ